MRLNPSRRPVDVDHGAVADEGVEAEVVQEQPHDAAMRKHEVSAGAQVIDEAMHPLGELGDRFASRRLELLEVF